MPAAPAPRPDRRAPSGPRHWTGGGHNPQLPGACGPRRRCRRLVGAGGRDDGAAPADGGVREQVPAEHEDLDGTFTLRLVCDEAVYRTLRDQAITATNGAVRQAQRIGGSSAEWNVTVEPSSREAVTVSVGGGTDTRGQGDSVCTDEGRPLSNSPSMRHGRTRRSGVYARRPPYRLSRRQRRR